MLLPKRVKYRRVHRGRLKGKAMRGNFVSNGEFGLWRFQKAGSPIQTASRSAALS